ncbi:MAG: FAD-dependent oxidoreductase [Candidatus Fermentibacteraceae bacterium]|nr:FAD-dependent oxidoreductase [Candidatus Fermentibacteraceae bacterium]
MSTDKPVAILGAGLAGLSAAHTLAARGVKVLVLEREDHAGGLASTCKESGFHFDLGPHRFHTQDQSILDGLHQLMPGKLIELQRVSSIHLLGRYFKYPLVLGEVLRQMPKSVGARIVASYMMAKASGILSRGGDKDFQSWVVARFGRKLFDIYFGPYTAKLWGCRPDQLSSDWASQRITVPSLSGLLKETIFPSDGAVRSLVSTFHYPKGGIGEISEALAGKVKGNGGEIVFDSPVSEVRIVDDGSFEIIAGNSGYSASSLISTIPVTDYIRALGEHVPEQIREDAGRLSYRAIAFAVLRLVSESPSVNDHWIYAAESEFRFNRISIPENFDCNLPGSGWQAVFEFTCREGDDTWRSEKALVDESILGGEKLGLFRTGDVTGWKVVRQSHAYPIYLKGYSLHVGRILDFLENLEGSVTCGRQGLFRYNNMDHSLEMGRVAALEILGEGSVRENFYWDSSTWADG